MKALIFGRDTKEISTLAAKLGFKLVKRNPQFVITYGGDGTLMQAEHDWPGVPKIILRNSLICKKCSVLSNEQVLQHVLDKKYSVEKLIKLRVKANGFTLETINDIIVHNKDARHAIRYQLTVNKKPIGGTIIGDGIVAATPFGSTAYYRTITDSSFELGIGLAFNNSTEQIDHLVLKETAKIGVEIVRGPAVIYADNQQKEIVVQTGDKISIEKSPRIANIVVPEQ